MAERQIPVRDAREAARAWVHEHASGRDDFRGAYFSGSTASMLPDAELPATSDVDVMVVLSTAQLPPKPGKLVFRGVLLEISYLSFGELADAEHVAGSYHLARSFARDSIISDPTGHLRRLHESVSRTFNDLTWIERRCDNALTRIETGLRGIDKGAPWHDQILCWIFPTGVTTHVILVAARQNPTVRLRYLAARRTLERCGLTSLYPRLLDLLGCGQATPAQVRRHLETLASTFDTTAALSRTPFSFSSDITAAARPIAIDGSQALIDAGDHREAVFWMIVTFARCQTILAADAPANVRDRCESVFRAAVSELLQIRDTTDLLNRAAAVEAFLPELRAAARAIAARDLSLSS